MSALVKICGLKTAEDAHIAIQSGADMIGCVFFEKSPRHVSVDEACDVFDMVGDADVLRVGLFVDPADDLLDHVLRYVRLDLIQLHGKETPERIDEIRLNYGLPVMKALSIETAEDVVAAKRYDNVADYLLFDAKPPKGSELPGGNAVTFDWSLLKNTSWTVPWLLAGGLTCENVRTALKESGADGVDVSSGVEVEKGIKSPELIQKFIENVK